MLGLSYLPEIHQITKIIRTEPEHTVAHMKLHTWAAREAIKLGKLHGSHDFHEHRLISVLREIHQQVSPLRQGHHILHLCPDAKLILNVQREDVRLEHPTLRKELEAIKVFGIMECPVQQRTEEERDNRVANVPNIQQFWEELTDGTSVYRSSYSRSSAFLKKEHKFMQYLLGHSVCGRFDATSSVNHADLFCLYDMVKHVKLHMGVRIVLVEPKDPSMQPLTADAVARMRDKIGPKRARTAGMIDERMEEEAYEAHPDVAAPGHAEVGRSSSSIDFQQQVLAQLAAMNMQFDHINTRLDDMEAANAQSRIEAHAYYEWMRGHYPPQGGPPFPPFDLYSMG
nr:hypothetical protein Iba_chr02fCG6980 [Ipomoea batatas]